MSIPPNINVNTGQTQNTSTTSKVKNDSTTKPKPSTAKTDEAEKDSYSKNSPTKSETSDKDVSKLDTQKKPEETKTSEQTPLPDGAHRVKKGDTLWTILSNRGFSAAEIKSKKIEEALAMNPQMKGNPNLLQVGWVLQLPVKDGQKSGQTKTEQKPDEKTSTKADTEKADTEKSETKESSSKQPTEGKTRTKKLSDGSVIKTTKKPDGSVVTKKRLPDGTTKVKRNDATKQVEKKNQDQKSYAISQVKNYMTKHLESIEAFPGFFTFTAKSNPKDPGQVIVKASTMKEQYSGVPYVVTMKVINGKVTVLSRTGEDE